MRDRRDTALRQLREAVGCLPRATRVAMLEGIDRNPIIVGAYTAPAGICPMLAAHRAGGRTSFIGFAKAWDAFAFRGARRCEARRATERELLVLHTYLEASLLDDDCPEQDLAAVAREHRALKGRPPVPPERVRRSERERTPQSTQHHERTPQQGSAPGDQDRSRELRHRSGWRWMRIVRSLDDYEDALRALGQDPVTETGATRPREGQPAPDPVASP